MLTDQEIFDRVITHLARQGGKSMSESDVECMYRGADGRKCAVGCLIDDDEYDEDNMEGRSINTLLRFGIKFKNFNENQVGLLMKLQKMHDNWLGEDKNWLCNQAMVISTKFGLNPAVVEEVLG